MLSHFFANIFCDSVDVVSIATPQQPEIYHRILFPPCCNIIVFCVEIIIPFHTVYTLLKSVLWQTNVHYVVMFELLCAVCCDVACYISGKRISGEESYSLLVFWTVCCSFPLYCLFVFWLWSCFVKALAHPGVMSLTFVWHICCHYYTVCGKPSTLLQ